MDQGKVWQRMLQTKLSYIFFVWFEQFLMSLDGQNWALHGALFNI